MALLQLNEGLVAGKPIKKEITYKDGVTGEEVTADVYVKQYGLAQARQFISVYNNSDIDQDEEMSKSIANNIVDDKGEPIFTADVVKTLKQDIVFALLAAIGEVNDPKPTKSAQKKKSSAS